VYGSSTFCGKSSASNNKRSNVEKMNLNANVMSNSANKRKKTVKSVQNGTVKNANKTVTMINANNLQINDVMNSVNAGKIAVRTTEIKSCPLFSTSL
jgi:hypothetical protein